MPMAAPAINDFVPSVLDCCCQVVAALSVHGSALLTRADWHQQPANGLPGWVLATLSKLPYLGSCRSGCWLLLPCMATGCHFHLFDLCGSGRYGMCLVDYNQHSLPALLRAECCSLKLLGSRQIKLSVSASPNTVCPAMAC